MEVESIINHFDKTCKKYLDVKQFSQLPGIYAIYFLGDRFPHFSEIKKNQIIYIGKTESNQEKRDAKTHFATGKTGSSTVRKSIGSILNSSITLNPIPRNEIDFEKRRFSHFKFDSISEEKITEWMKSNLGLAFFEYPKSKIEIDNLETELINYVCPILNISKNIKNKYRLEISSLRANLAKKAHSGISSNKIKTLNKIQPVKILTENYSNKDIIIDNITKKDIALGILRILKNNKSFFPGEMIGSTKVYQLKLVYNSIDYNATYRIGSIDGNSRSGILKSELFKGLKLTENSIIKIQKVGEYYLLKDLS